MPVTTAGTENLYGRMERMSQLQPLFCSVAFDGRDETTESAIGIASTAKSFLGLEMQVNLTGYTSTPEEVKAKLDVLRMKHIQNLLVLQEAKGRRVTDKFIFTRRGLGEIYSCSLRRYFGIAVAGYQRAMRMCRSTTGSATLEKRLRQGRPHHHMILGQRLFQVL